MPYGMDSVHAALFDCDLFVAIGNGADTLELNLAPDPVSDFAQVRRGPATENVPAWVEEMLQ